MEIIDWYNLSLKQSFHFLFESKQSAKLSELGERQVCEFILYLQEKKRWRDNPHIPEQKENLAMISTLTYVRGLRAFFNWLYKQHYSSENRLANLKPPKAQHKSYPRNLSE